MSIPKYWCMVEASIKDSERGWSLKLFIIRRDCQMKPWRNTKTWDTDTGDLGSNPTNYAHQFSYCFFMLRNNNYLSRLNCISKYQWGSVAQSLSRWFVQLRTFQSWDARFESSSWHIGTWQLLAAAMAWGPSCLSPKGVRVVRAGKDKEGPGDSYPPEGCVRRSPRWFARLWVSPMPGRHSD